MSKYDYYLYCTLVLASYSEVIKLLMQANANEHQMAMMQLMYGASQVQH